MIAMKFHSIPMFSGSGNTERLVRMLFVWVCWKSNMAAINRKLIGNDSTDVFGVR